MDDSKKVIDQLKGIKLYDMHNLRPAEYNLTIAREVGKEKKGKGAKGKGPLDDKN